MLITMGGHCRLGGMQDGPGKDLNRDSSPQACTFAEAMDSTRQGQWCACFGTDLFNLSDSLQNKNGISFLVLFLYSL